MGNFQVLKKAVAAQFEKMQKHQLFRVAVEGRELWEAYLTAFPPGSDPIYRTRSEHDCACCRNFVRGVGNAVAVIDGKIASIWDVSIPTEPAYQQVADALSKVVKAKGIEDKFLYFQKTAGTDKNFEQLTDEAKTVKTWDHFFVNVDHRFVKKNADIASALAEPRETKNVLLRSLLEIDDESVDAVLDMIAQNSLYRGEEHKFAVESFRDLKKQFKLLKSDAERDAFAWTSATAVGTAGSVGRIRNTSIGTLLVDVSGGMDLEEAVKAFEAKIAPANYKRPTAPVTKAMVEKAKLTVEELGLTSALSRRHATIHDVTINNVVFANRDARQAIGEGSVFDDLGTTSLSSKSFDRLEEISVEKFLSDVLPRAQSLEIMVENRHTPNFVSLIAPEDPTSGMLFKWGNRFSWSYNGEVADSIKERVKAAGGSVVGDLCCRLAWEYTDDLDFHMHEPGPRGHHIGYQNRRQLSPSGGMLDLDANGADGPRPNPAENIFYVNRHQMKEGVYQLEVNNFSRRSDGRGFVVEIEFDGQVHHVEYDKVLGTGKTVIVAKIQYSHKSGFEIVESLPSSQTSREVWLLQTQTFHPVSVLLLSPNHWDDRTVGNKHYFFMIDGATNAGNARGFFNEFLKEDLTPHRKVLEMVGGKMKVGGSNQQLSGLGFSSTMRNTIVCRVKGSFTRMLKIAF